MPKTTTKVNEQTNDVTILITPRDQWLPRGRKPRSMICTVPAYVEAACHLISRRGRYGAHLSEIGIDKSVNSGRAALAECALAGIQVRVTSIPNRATGLREEWVIGDFDVVEIDASTSDAA